MNKKMKRKEKNRKKPEFLNLYKIKKFKVPSIKEERNKDVKNETIVK